MRLIVAEVLSRTWVRDKTSKNRQKPGLGLSFFIDMQGTGLTLFAQRNKAQGTLAISRQSLFKKCRQILKLIGYKTVISRGSYEKRLILPINFEELLATVPCWFWLFSRGSPVPTIVIEYFCSRPQYQRASGDKNELPGTYSYKK